MHPGVLWLQPGFNPDMPIFPLSPANGGILLPMA